MGDREHIAGRFPVTRGKRELENACTMGSKGTALCLDLICGNGEYSRDGEAFDEFGVYWSHLMHGVLICQLGENSDL